ncbi:hypothetical protein CBP05_27440 [Pseudomonas putida]|nr:hypothetical protein CBP05_27440 [Pseudomonas putida]OUS87382.1 hypothetical protein CBP06_14560 [Pseudomonas putida]
MASSRRHRRHAQPPRHSAAIEVDSIPVGAGLPANTGKAGAIHRGGFFAGKPAPTGNVCGSGD